MGEAVVAPALASLRGYWDRATPPQVLTYLVGIALIAVGLAHLAAWAATGGPWLGPLGWRKPTTFGVSFGLTTGRARTPAVRRSPPSGRRGS